MFSSINYLFLLFFISIYLCLSSPPGMEFSIIQWNINSFFTRLPFIQKLIADSSPMVVCLQETNFKARHNPSLKNFTFFRKDRLLTARDTASGGVATLVHKSLHAKVIPIQSDLETLTVEISGRRKLQVCNIYIDPRKKFSSLDLTDISSQLTAPYIILSDLNSHSPQWGCTYLNTRGREVEKWLDSSNIVLLNDGTHTHTSFSHNMSSAIDLSFCSPDLGAALSWEVNYFPHDSDHHPIRVNFLERDTGNNQDPGTKKWHFDRANWGKFQAILDEKHSKSSLNSDINIAVEEFSNDIIYASNLSIPVSNSKNQKARVPWWTQDCYEAIKNKNRLY